MNVLCVNVDARFNLAMRKVYNYHLQRGDNVRLMNCGYDAYKKHGEIVINGKPYDKVYVSIIFENNSNVKVAGSENVVYGGVGSSNPLSVLPPEIENIQPYYFENENISYGFMTRGCVRNCYFCKVPKTEGKIRFVCHPSKICVKEKTVFYDNNILGYSNHYDLLQWLSDHKIKCQFNQGLDFRLTNEENLSILSSIPLFGDIIFAFDNLSYQPMIDSKSPLIFEYFNKPWRTKWYLYVNPKDPLDSIIKRVNWCYEHHALPYVMRDRAIDSMNQEIRNFYTDVSAWCNQPSLFKTKSFEDFLEIRHTNKERIRSTLNLWNHPKP